MQHQNAFGLLDRPPDFDPAPPVIMPWSAQRGRSARKRIEIMWQSAKNASVFQAS